MLYTLATAIFDLTGRLHWHPFLPRCSCSDSLDDESIAYRRRLMMG
jgi:hypothetical protein